MYYFNQVEKAKVLQGRTIKYLAEQKLHCNVAYLCLILSGKQGCSMRLANDIVKCISPSAQLEDYFVRKEK